MVAVGMALLYLGYCGDLLAMFWITGKNVGLTTLFSSTWPPNVPSATGAKSQTPAKPTGGAGNQGIAGNTNPAQSAPAKGGTAKLNNT